MNSPTLPLLSLAAVVLAAVPSRAQQLLTEVFGGQIGGQFGAAIGKFDDFDQDGVADVLIGAPGVNHGLGLIDGGAGHVVSGRTGAILSTAISRHAGARLGDRIVGLGDVDGDGSPDFAMSGPMYSSRTGIVAVHRGDGTPLWISIGENYSEFGTGLCRARDLDGDGRDELLVGAPENSNVRPFGRVLKFDGATGQSHGMWAGSDRTSFGYSLANLGDIDGDGFDEIAISEPAFTYNGASSGRILVLRADRLGGQSFVWEQFRTFQSADQAGRAMANAGDVNGDGHADVICSTRTGRIYLLSGLTGDVITSIPAVEVDSGAAVCGIGDQNDDGIAEFAVGAPRRSNNAGRVYVYDGASRRVLYWTDGAAGSNFGTSIANLGDLDGDGRDEFAIGAPTHVRGLQPVGRVAIYRTRIQGSVSTYGQACGGAHGPLDLIGVGTPRPASTIGVRLYNPAPHSFGTWLYGTSRSISPIGPLPIDLTALGFVGCSLLQNMQSTASFAVGNQVYLSNMLDLPNRMNLVGLELYMQAAMIDPTSAGGLTFSNGVEFSIGNQ